MPVTTTRELGIQQQTSSALEDSIVKEFIREGLYGAPIPLSEGEMESLMELIEDPENASRQAVALAREAILAAVDNQVGADIATIALERGEPGMGVYQTNHI
jgi:hypothetical protein